MKSAPVIFHESKQTSGSVEPRKGGSQEASIKTAASFANAASFNYHLIGKCTESWLAWPSGKNTCFVCGDRVFGSDSRKNESCDGKQWLEMRP